MNTFRFMFVFFLSFLVLDTHCHGDCQGWCDFLGLCGATTCAHTSDCDTGYDCTEFAIDFYCCAYGGNMQCSGSTMNAQKWLGTLGQQTKRR